MKDLPKDIQSASISSDQLKTWLADLEEYAPQVLSAVRRGELILMTRSVAESARNMARKYTDATLDLAALTTQKVALLNALFYLMKSIEGIALKADKILHLLQVLGIGEEVDKFKLMSALAVNFSLVMETKNDILNAFDASWLARIDISGLAPLLAETGLDMTPYQQLPALIQKFQPQQPAALPATQ